MVLAVLLGWAVALLNRRARHKSLVTVVGTLLFLAVYYAAFQWVGNAVDALALDAVQAGAAASRAAAPLRLLGFAAVGNIPALLLLLALAAACMVLCGKALAKPYLRLLTLEPGKIKTEYRAKAQKKQPLHRALLRRELLHLGACPMWLLNCALSSLLLPALGVAALWKAADLRAFTAAYPPESLPMLVCGMVCTAAAMTFITAPSVSLEGDTLWLLQSLPVAPHSGRAGTARAGGAGSLCVADSAAWACFRTVSAQPPLGQRGRCGQAERRQYAGDVRRVAAGGRGAVFAPDLTGLRRAAAGSTDCLSGGAAGAGPIAAPLAVHLRRSPVCRPALKWEEFYQRKIGQLADCPILHSYGKQRHCGKNDAFCSYSASSAVRAARMFASLVCQISNSEKPGRPMGTPSRRKVMRLSSTCLPERWNARAPV